ncbi:hypothetical protein [Actinoplanes subtropicus]|uniref:hypothetical protein n=1 Tax=Actinoplanes subtropicus TaxID=543632 RepID=UPI0014704823|nr:hypothetical protein [Actinoplanes subtropicus]
MVTLSCWAIWRPLYASFAATAGMPGAQVRTGMVALGSPANAIVSVTGAIPGSFGSSCLRITYTGSLTGHVRLYLTPAGIAGTGLASYLTLQVKQGSGGNVDCSDFVPAATVYNPAGLIDTTKTVTAFGAASPGYATGVDSWTAATSDTRTYEFNWQLQDDNAAESRTASLTFTWEAQS